MKLLFLDVDGVLNRHEFDPDVLCGQIHKDKVELLNFVLRETDARIVLSSAWRYLVHRGEMNLTGLEWLLRSHGVLAGRLAGITPPDTLVRREYNGVPDSWPVENERGRQIADYLADLPPRAYPVPPVYAVVDDLDLGIREAGHPFVQTDGGVGLTEKEANLLIGLLGRAT